MLRTHWEKLFYLALSKLGYNNSNPNTNGEYRALKEIANDYVENKITIFDVGANIGDFSNQVSALFKYSELTLMAFEPSSRSFSTLKDNTANNPAIQLFNIGFGEKPESVKLYFDTNGSEMASTYKRNLDHLNIHMDNFEQIELSTIDYFCKQKGISIIDFLKIDVEGKELDVLMGAQSLIESKQIKYIMFEFGGTDIDSRVFFKDFYLLLKDKYDLFRLTGNSMIPITMYHEGLEIFQFCMYLAKLKF